MIQIEVLEKRALIAEGPPDHTNKIPWNHNMWGSIRLPSMIVEAVSVKE